MIPAAGRPQVLALRDVREVRQVLAEMQVSAPGMDIMERKSLFRLVLLKGVGMRAANILKQEMLARGGEVATSREVYEMGGRETDCLVMGTLAQYERLLPKLRDQPFGLGQISKSLGAALTNYEADEVETHPALDLSQKPVVMGILNVTPDSFSEEGVNFDTRTAVQAGIRIAEEGAAFIDVGGESTRPGSTGVEEAEELRRVIPVIRELAGQAGLKVSIDTSKARVAEEALSVGAFMVNDTTALRKDPKMADLVREAGCPVVLMHMKGEPRVMQDNPTYDNVLEEIYDFFVERLTWAIDQGIEERNLIIDPGIGFGKTTEHNLALLRHLGSFRSLGRPVALGASRKRFLGHILDLPKADERVLGTAATSVIAAMQDIHILRVHDVKANVEAIRVTRAIFPERA